MIRLFQLLVFGHCHKWKIIRSNRKDYTNSSGKVVDVNIVDTLQCEHCGKLKVFEG